MRGKKTISALAMILLLGGSLAGCGQQASQERSTTTYSYIYKVDPQTLDYVLRNFAATSDVTTQMVDGLLENDKYGDLIPSLAKDWSVSNNGKTYTYHLRKDAKWYTADGEEYAPVTAHDFVTGLKYAADGKADALYLVQDSVEGLDDYVQGKTTDFSTVGVKAIDDYTLQYTLNRPEPYWNSKTTVGVLFPVNDEFLKAKGKDFGSADPSSILVNGPYFLTAWTTQVSIEFTKNDYYWDKDNVKWNHIKLTYNNGTDLDSIYQKFTDGIYSQAQVYPTRSMYDVVKQQNGDNVIYTPQDGTTYYMSLNLNRTNYGQTAKTSENQKIATRTALLNKNFRQALMFSVDREKYLAQQLGKEGASAGIRNTLVPTSFTQVGDKNFGEVVQEEVEALDSVWEGVNLEDGQNGAYNPQKAQMALAKAKEELAAQGIAETIRLDLPVMQSDPTKVQQAQSLKQSIEGTLGVENIQIDLQMMDETSYTNEVFYAETPDQNDFDISTAAGWGPDYDDPSTYLDINSPIRGAGIHYNGITLKEDIGLVNQVGLNVYQQLLDMANHEDFYIGRRYALYAKAQAWLTDSCINIPLNSKGAEPQVTRVKPFSEKYSFYGTKGTNYYKGRELQKDIVTAKDYAAAYKQWQKEKEIANQESLKENAAHVIKRERGSVI